jgi:hypothetical protein
MIFQEVTMKISTERLFEFEDGASPLALLYDPSRNMFVLNYWQHPSWNADVPEGLKTVLLDFDTKEVVHLANGLKLLGITSEGKLFAIQDSFSNKKRNLVIYDPREAVTTKSIPVALFYGYGKSYLIEHGINKLFISFFGSDYGKDEGFIIVDAKSERIVKELSLNGRPRNMVANEEKDRLFVSVAGFDNKRRLACLDTGKDEVVESFELDFYPVKAVLKNDVILLLELFKRIHYFDTKQKKVVDSKDIPGIFSVEPTGDSQYLLLLKEGEEPTPVIDRLALYDLGCGRVAYEQKISHGQLLKTIDRRMFFTDIVDDALTINEIHIA